MVDKELAMNLNVVQLFLIVFLGSAFGGVLTSIFFVWVFYRVNRAKVAQAMKEMMRENKEVESSVYDPHRIVARNLESHLQKGGSLEEWVEKQMARYQAKSGEEDG